MWPSVQQMGRIGQINECFEKGHERSPTNMIKKIKIKRKEFEIIQIQMSMGKMLSSHMAIASFIILYFIS